MSDKNIISKYNILEINPICQINDINQSEMIINDLDTLEKKYNRYNNSLIQKNLPTVYKSKNIIKNTDPYDELIQSKNVIIDDLKKENIRLKQEHIDLSIIYNNKIDMMRQQHRKELHNQYKEFVKRKN